METTKKVNWSANTLVKLADIYEFISETQGEPAADLYLQNILDFGEQLSKKSEHYSFCRNPKLQEKGYRCALFKRKHILIYISKEVQVDILAIIHIKQNPADYENT